MELLKFLRVSIDKIFIKFLKFWKTLLFLFKEDIFLKFFLLLFYALILSVHLFWCILIYFLYISYYFVRWFILLFRFYLVFLTCIYFKKITITFSYGKYLHEQLREIINHRNHRLQKLTQTQHQPRGQNHHRYHHRYFIRDSGNFRQHKSDSLFVIT